MNPVALRGLIWTTLVTLTPAAVLLLALFLTACGTDPVVVPMPVVVTYPKPVIPNECRAAMRKKFPLLPIVADGSPTPYEVLETRWLDARAISRMNGVREETCECWLIDQFGSDAEKAEAATMCSKRPLQPDAKSAP